MSTETKMVAQHGSVVAYLNNKLVLETKEEQGRMKTAAVRTVNVLSSTAALAAGIVEVAVRTALYIPFKIVHFFTSKNWERLDASFKAFVQGLESAVNGVAFAMKNIFAQVNDAHVNGIKFPPKPVVVAPAPVVEAPAPAPVPVVKTKMQKAKEFASNHKLAIGLATTATLAVAAAAVGYKFDVRGFGTLVDTNASKAWNFVSTNAVDFKDYVVTKAIDLKDYAVAHPYKTAGMATAGTTALAAVAYFRKAIGHGVVVATKATANGVVAATKATANIVKAHPYIAAGTTVAAGAGVAAYKIYA